MSGNVEVIERWFDEHVDAVYRYAARRVGAEVAGDVVSETFRRALTGIAGYDAGRGTPRLWLLGIATNVLRRHWHTEERQLRSQALVAAQRQVIGDPLVHVEDGVDARRRLDRLVDAVDALSADDRDVLVLVAWEAMTAAEVGAVLGIPAGTVRSRLNRVRAQLREFERVAQTGGRDDG